MPVAGQASGISEISEAKKLRHQYEDMWRASGVSVHCEMFQTWRQLVLNSDEDGRKETFLG